MSLDTIIATINFIGSKYKISLITSGEFSLLIVVFVSLDGEEEDHDGAEGDGRVRRALPVDERVHDSLRRPHLGGDQ